MQDQQTAEGIKRGEFLRTLGLSSSALMAFYCLGTFSSCSKSSDPQPAATTPGTTPGSTTTGLTGNAETAKGKINFTLDLTSTMYKTLKTAGGYVTPGDIIVAKVKGGNFVALSKACTHIGVTIEYHLTEDEFYCPHQGSLFSDAGVVKKGPAAINLKTYTATLSADGNSLVITE